MKYIAEIGRVIARIKRNKTPDIIKEQVFSELQISRRQKKKKTTTQECQVADYNILQRNEINSTKP